MGLVFLYPVHAVSQRGDIDVKPAQRAGLMIMAFGQDGLQHGQRFDPREIDGEHFGIRVRDSLLDIEITAGINRIGADMTFEDDNRLGQSAP